MKRISSQNIKRWNELGPRNLFGQVLYEIACERRDVVALGADLATAVRLQEFMKSFPERFVQVGIAEQNLVGIAAGLAASGKIPFISTFATFISMRACEQVRTDVAYPGLNVKLIGILGGIVSGTLGATHCSLEDIGIMRSIPNMVVIDPADGLELVKTMYAALEYKGPVYIRLEGNATFNTQIYSSDYSFAIGRAVILKEGTDATIISTGLMASVALGASKILETRGINVQVINMHTVKPIDKEAIINAAKKTREIITVEEHSLLNGLGSAVADVLASQGTGRLHRLALPDEFGKTISPYQGLLAKYGLTAENLAEVVERRIGEREDSHVFAN